MILFLNNQPVSLATKSNLVVERSVSLLGSNSKTSIDTPWLGDELTIESLFPQWILKEYESNTTNVTVVPIIKNYMRWLLSQEYGYGAQLNWENIRVPLYMNSIFLEALADFYFFGADFSQEPLATILPNIRRFSIKVDENYFNIKGTPVAVKYALCTLLGFEWDYINVSSTSYVNMTIKTDSSNLSSLLSYKNFIETYIVPAGIVVNYTTL
jgi:hypothetical protein